MSADVLVMSPLLPIRPGELRRQSEVLLRTIHLAERLHRAYGIGHVLLQRGLTLTLAVFVSTSEVEFAVRPRSAEDRPFPFVEVVNVVGKFGNALMRCTNVRDEPSVLIAPFESRNLVVSIDLVFRLRVVIDMMR